MSQKIKKKILFVSPEVQPFAGTGGLGEVAGSLPTALAKKHKYDVRVILPLYGSVGQEWRDKMTFLKHFDVNLAWRSQYAGIFELKKEGVTYYFIDNEFYFKRDSLYGSYDDGERFAFFNKAVMETMSQLDFYPDLVHCNDWQTALVPIYNYYVYHYGFKSVFTIHNIAYQGKFDLAILGDVFDLPPEAGAAVEYGGCINLLKGAIETSNLVNTVSPSYAEELKSPQYAEGLEEIICKNSFKISGILNGINVGSYNPSKDTDIECLYDETQTEGKARCKEALQKLSDLPIKKDTPVMAMITRLVAHKGVDFIKCCMEDLLQEDVQLVVLGTGDREYEDYFRYLEAKYPDKVKAFITFNGKLSHQVYAGADIFLMPSVSEPCGLSQMIACRYGTVPVVRETGGLRDSIRDCTLGEGNGFTFNSMDFGDLAYAIRRALDLYHNEESWSALVSYIMGLDFSWRKSAGEYDKLYQQLFS